MHITSIALPVMMGVRDLVQAVSRIQTFRSRVEPIEADVDDMYWELGKDTCMDIVRFAIRTARESRHEKVLTFAVHKGGDKTLDRLGGSTSDEHRILTEREVVDFVQWDLFHNTIAVIGRIILTQGKRGVPIGGHLAGLIAELWAIYAEHRAFATKSESRSEIQTAWQAGVGGLKLGKRVKVVLPGAEVFMCMHDASSHQLLGDIWASKKRHTIGLEDVQRAGLKGWWSPADSLLVWVTIENQDVPILGIVPWDSAPGGGTHHILHRTPRRDIERVRNFLSQLHPSDFLMGELGHKSTPAELQGPCVLLATFRNNIYIYIYIYIYIFLINIPESMSSNIKQIVMQLLKSMYGVPLKWEAHGPTVHVPAAHWWLSGNVKLGLIWGSVVHCDVFVLVCCAFCMLGNVHLMFLEVLDTHLVKVQGGGYFFWRRLS